MLSSYGVEIVANQMQFSLGNTALVDAGFNVNTAKNEAVTRAGDVMEYCMEKRIAMQAWSPLQYGAIEGVFVGNERFPILNAELDVLAEKYNCTPAAIAVAWILRHPAGIQVVTGTTSAERMRELCVATDVELTREEWYKLYLSTGKRLP
jgi:predicted oxidoreductase